MAPSRRQMLGGLVLPMLPIACSPSVPGLRTGASVPQRAGAPEDIARDEDYWSQIARCFTVDRTMVNLNNGGVSPAPGLVQDAMKRHLDFANTAPPPHALWSVAPPLREAVRQRLARAFGVDTEEIALTRNASEGLEICQLGLDLEPGDEVLATTQDYPRMITAFQQRQRRNKIVLRQFDIPVPAEDDAKIVSLYEANIGPRTRLILATHMINLTGQILPVRDIVRMARRRNIPVIVDGAHALAHFDFKISDLECDYYATSLHKWLFAPHGTGLLYVRRDKIRSLWPLMAAPPSMDNDIRKFEEIGTHPEAATLAIAEALTFHEALGAARKEARLVYLRDTWAKRLLATGRARLHTSLLPAPARFSAGIATVDIEGIDIDALRIHLWDKHRILTTGIYHDKFRGLRVSPSIYTTLEELDRFCTAIENVIKHGLG